jgi:outer membrane protein assembly factor BamB
MNPLVVIAVNPNGTESWRHTLTTGLGYNVGAAGGPAVDSAGTVVVATAGGACFSGIAYACTTTDATAVSSSGTTLWRKWLGNVANGGNISPPAIGTDGTVYVGGGDGALHALVPAP